MSQLSLIAMLSFALTNCAARSSTNSIDNAVSKSYTDREQSIKELELLVKSPPSVDDLPYALLHAGEQRRLNGDIEQASKWFNRLNNEFPESSLKNAGIIGITLIDAIDGIKGNTIGRLQLYARTPELTDTMRSDLYRILAIHHQKSSPDTAGYYAKNAWKYGAKDPVTLSRLSRDLSGSPGALTTETDIKAPLESVKPTETQLAPEGAEAIRQFLADKEFEKVVELCVNAATAADESIPEEKIRAFKLRAEAEDPFNNRKIGVLLPLSGKYAPAAKEFQQSINFANSSLLEPMEIVYFDTAGEAETAEKGVESLILEHGVSVILGPLLKGTVQEAAAVAQTFEIPMITLSRTKEPLSAGDHIHYVNLPVSTQINKLLDHAIMDRGWGKFAAMAPDNAHGHLVVEKFSEEVIKRGASFVQSHFYDPSVRDFLPAARVMAGRDPEAAHSRDPVEVEYDAIFLPDNHRNTPLIASALAYEGFAVGEFKPRRDAEPIHLLGLNSWNHPGILKTSGAYLRKAIFVDAFWADLDKEEVSDFKRNFKDEIGRRPKIYDAVIYDSVQLISQVLSKKPESRPDVLDALTKTEISEPLTGAKGFDSSRELNRDLMVLEIKSSGFRVWSEEEND